MMSDLDEVRTSIDAGLAARSAGGAEGQRAGGASVASALGSTQSYCFTTSATSGGGVSAVDPGSGAGFVGAQGRCCGRRLR